MSHAIDYDVKRSKILNCADQLFSSKGYELTTVNTILKEVGIAKGTFYYYFKSKEEVMDAVIMRSIEEEVHYVNSILVNEMLTPIEKLIISIFKKKESKDGKEKIERLYKADNALMKQRAMQRTLEIICPLYAEIIKEGNKKGEFSSSNPLLDIQFLIAGAQTLYDLNKVKNSTIQIDTEVTINNMFKILKIDENQISKEKVKRIIIQNNK